jgi:hypothetical protein
MFHANHAGSDHPFFCGMVHTKAVLVEDYDPLSENDLIEKIVNILLLSDKSLEYIKSRFPEYFNSHKEHIALYRNYCSAKKTFDAKFRTRMNTYDSIISFSPSELKLLLSGYEERLKKKERTTNRSDATTLTLHWRRLLTSSNRRKKKTSMLLFIPLKITSPII